MLAWLACAPPPAPERHGEKAGAGAAELERDREACVGCAIEEGADATRGYEHPVRGESFVECIEERG